MGRLRPRSYYIEDPLLPAYTEEKKKLDHFY